MQRITNSSFNSKIGNYKNKPEKSNIISFAGQIKEKLDPQKVWNTFTNEIMPVYRETNHCDNICKHLEQTLKNIEFNGKKDFDVKVIPYTDEQGRRKHNVIATRHNVKDNNAVILQAHMDMVWVTDRKDENDNRIELVEEIINGEKWFTAKDTTLGADNGIGLALALEIAKSPAFKDIPLQIIFTEDEETTSEGALNVKGSDIKGKIGINLDAEYFGRIIAGCCGMEIYDIKDKKVPTIPLAKLDKNNPNTTYKSLTIGLKGAKGGHARDVHLGGVNAFTEVITAVNNLPEELKKFVHIREIKGSGENDKMNAIPTKASVQLVVAEDKLEEVKDFIYYNLNQVVEKKKADKGDSELGIILKASKNNIPNETKVLEPNFQNRLLKVFSGSKIDFNEIKINLTDDLEIKPDNARLHSGLYKLHDDPNKPCFGDIVTSQNIGILHLEDGKLNISIGLRSSNNAHLKYFNSKSKAALAYLLDEKVQQKASDHSPVWSQFNSKLSDLAIQAYKDTGVGNPIKKDNHGCLEPGIIIDNVKKAGKYITFIAAGPDIENPHTTKERIRANSIVGISDFITDLLFKIKNEIIKS